jgi:hypothetical protein
MFMTTQNVILWTVVLWVGTPAGQEAMAQNASGVIDTNEANVVLQPNDIMNARIYRVKNLDWVTAVDSNGKRKPQAGVVQEMEAQGVKIRIHYCEFESKEEAHNAAESHTKNVAAMFHSGLWSNATHKTIGDEAWFTDNESVVGLLVRSGRVCVLLSCREGDMNQRRSAAEQVAEQIVTKVGSGKRVIVP